MIISFICTLSLLVGIWIALLNWRCFYIGLVKKAYSPSWIPLLGGIFMFLGFYFFPNNPVKHMAFIAFLLDWGSLPGIGHAIIYHQLHNKK
ncbi:hypothetical protein [Diaphorobacter ruginosibacter]|uniref:hypothetical protein n=1 Tax=Diaphorobacter ruginosibacter TaxID=1715720 RepID=UPI00333E861F